jgi:hypothetical protein
LGAGVQHNQPGKKYQPVLAKAVEWLVSQTKPNGDLRGAGTMYDHGIASAALAEAYGLSKDEKLAGTVKNIVEFIIQAQNKQTGGWRYKPGDEGDTSVFGWQMLALHNARLAKINVPAATLELADRWLIRVCSGQHGGLYGYDSKKPKPAMTAEGMFCRQLLGASPEEPRMEESAAYLIASLPDVKKTDFYYWYYGTLALHNHQGPAWETWNKKLKHILLAAQLKDGSERGSWQPTGLWSKESGRVVTTAMSALMLEVYYRYLPLQGNSSNKTTEAQPAR